MRRVGITCLALGKKADPFVTLAYSVNEISVKIVSVVMLFTPVRVHVDRGPQRKRQGRHFVRHAHFIGAALADGQGSGTGAGAEGIERCGHNLGKELSCWIR